MGISSISGVNIAAASTVASGDNAAPSVSGGTSTNTSIPAVPGSGMRGLIELFANRSADGGADTSGKQDKATVYLGSIRVPALALVFQDEDD